MVRHSKEDALTTREFELLLEGAQRLSDPYRLQAITATFLCGRLGLRAGELAHLSSDWIDLRNQVVEIPRTEPCHGARGADEPCSYCHALVDQKVSNDPSVNREAALDEMWSPKTESSIRGVPFGYDPRATIWIERFVEQYDAWPNSRQSVNRRVEKAAEAAEEVSKNDIYPHALRATAATYHVGRGLSMLPLQQMMGWAEASTARNYVAESHENTARQLDRIHA